MVRGRLLRVKLLIMVVWRIRVGAIGLLLVCRICLIGLLRWELSLKLLIYIVLLGLLIWNRNRGLNRYRNHFWGRILHFEGLRWKKSKLFLFRRFLSIIILLRLPLGFIGRIGLRPSPDSLSGLLVVFVCLLIAHVWIWIFKWPKKINFFTRGRKKLLPFLPGILRRE